MSQPVSSDHARVTDEAVTSAARVELCYVFFLAIWEVCVVVLNCHEVANGGSL